MPMLRDVHCKAPVGPIRASRLGAHFFVAVLLFPVYSTLSFLLSKECHFKCHFIVTSDSSCTTAGFVNLFLAKDSL